MFIMIDNYDSFTYNLVHLLSEFGVRFQVFRNDRITVDELEALEPEGVILSPGPGRPDDAGICLEVVRRLGSRLPILGVCLGHQAIGQAFGAKVVHARALFHGKGSPVTHNGRGIFKDVKSPFFAMRYHSLVVDRATLPDCLEVSAETEDGEIMGLRHKELPIVGVQFHPESILAEESHRMTQNFLNGVTL